MITVQTEWTHMPLANNSAFNIRPEAAHARSGYAFPELYPRVGLIVPEISGDNLLGREVIHDSAFVGLMPIYQGKG